MKKKFKYILKSLLFFYFIIGLILSVNTGITTDELPNLYIWNLNLEAIKDFLDLTIPVIKIYIITSGDIKVLVFTTFLIHIYF